MNVSENKRVLYIIVLRSNNVSEKKLLVMFDELEHSEYCFRVK